jgi:LmbE family N-acetylglucosaminyl deacetylase
VIDIEPVLEVKREAALCHRTQHALFVRRRSREAGRALTVEEVILKQESIRRAYPAAGDREDDRLLEHLSPWAIDFSL